MKHRYPNLFIPGAPKSATSAIADYLAARTDVTFGPIKEPNFWSSDMPSFALREGLRSESDYKALYSAETGIRYWLDASTHYLVSAVAIENIMRAIPDARFVVCLRDQSEIASAWHMQMLNAGYETETDFREAWALLETRRHGNAIPKRCPEPILLDYEAVASVGLQLQRLFDQVPRERVHIVHMNDLKQDSHAVYLDLLRFLELPDDGATVFEKRNAAHVNRSATLSHLIRHPGIRPWLNRGVRWLGAENAQRVKSTVKKILYRPAARAEITASFQSELDACFASDRAILGRILDQRSAPDAA